MAEVVTRFAPSPSGAPHAGNIRTALFSWLWAKKNGGKFILRIEDTNAEKSTAESIKVIFDTLGWLGIKSDVEVIYQSKRAAIYKEYVEKLLASGHAYKCFCSAEELDRKRDEQYAKGDKPKYDKTCLKLTAEELKKLEDAGAPYVVRFKVPEYGGVQWKDLVRARVQVRHIELSDFIIQRTDGSVTFLLANMLDDALQGVTHVLRGEDGIAHCHGQILLSEALGFPIPTYGHLPFVLNNNGDKLSKRNGDDSILDLRDKGFLPEAVINALCRIGWSHGNQEIFSVEELCELFNVESIGKGAGKFDPDKLLHINQQWIKRLDPELLATYLCPFIAKRDIEMGEFFHGPRIADAAKTLQTRAKTLEDMADQIGFYYKSDFPLDPLEHAPKEHLKVLRNELERTWEHKPEHLQHTVELTCKSCGITIKELGPLVRKALSGSLVAPGIVEIMAVLGKEETIKRLDRAINL